MLGPTLGSETRSQLVSYPKAAGNGGSARFSSQCIAIPRLLHSIRPTFNRILKSPSDGSIANQSGSAQSKIAASSIQLARGTRLVRSTHPCEAVGPCPEIPDSRPISLLLGLLSPRFVALVAFCSRLYLHRPWQAFSTLRPNSIPEDPCHPCLTSISQQFAQLIQWEESKANDLTANTSLRTSSIASFLVGQAPFDRGHFDSGNTSGRTCMNRGSNGLRSVSGLTDQLRVRD